MATVSWRTARAEIATILASLAIADPVEQAIKRVYETPPASVPDLPCIIILGATKDVGRSAGLRMREHIAHLRLVVHDADLNREADLIDSFQEAITTKFDENLTLNGKVTDLRGPAWELPAQFDAGGQRTNGTADCTVAFRMHDTPTLAG